MRLARLIKRHRLANDFNERRLLAKSFAAWEVSCIDTKSILHQAREQKSFRQVTLLFKHWHDFATKAKGGRTVKEEQAEHLGQRLCLRLAIQQWRCGVVSSKEERKVAELCDAKRQQVFSWLGEL